MPAPIERPVAAQFCATFLKPEMLHIYRQITSLRAFRPVVLTQKRESQDRFPFDDVTLIPKARTRELRRFWQKEIAERPVQIYRGEAHRIAADLDRLRARVLHIYFGHIGVYLLPLIELRKLPVIVSFHGADAMVDLEKPHYREAAKSMLQKATLILARSQSLVDRIAALACPREKIRIHRTGIPLDQLPFSQRAAPPEGAWKLMQACRLIPKKGISTTLRAFAAFVRRFPAATLTIAGEGPMLGALQALAHELRIADKVRFAGFLSQTELFAMFQESHFFIHPSELTEDGNQEGVPNAMLEAMATGLPALATVHGGIPEAIEHGVSGFLVPEHDDHALAVATIGLADEPARYAAMSATASRVVAEKFEIGAQTRQLESFYEEAIARGAAS